MNNSDKRQAVGNSTWDPSSIEFKAPPLLIEDDESDHEKSFAELIEELKRERQYAP